MSNSPPSPSPTTLPALDASWLIFWPYALTLVIVARWVGHAMFEGWLARFATMGAIAIGLLPWGRWLRPRVARVLEWAGGAVLLICYFTVLAPFALLSRIIGDPLRMRRGPGAPAQWLSRRPLPDTVEAARSEY